MTERREERLSREDREAQEVLLSRLFAVVIVSTVGAVMLLFGAMVLGIAVRLFLTLAGIG